MPDPRPQSIELIARGALVHAGRLLVCRSVKRGYGYLPGGHVDPGESAAAACVREFREELGRTIVVGAPLLVCEARFVETKPDGTPVPRHEVNLVFHVEPHGSDPIADPSAWATSREPKIAFRWVSRDALDADDLRPGAIRDWLAGRSDLWQGRPTGRLDWLAVTD
ncbi:MAG: NUDIX domain-containing protein [Phycisphaerales bacterium]|nr:NUDIX domain-containing protein [Phycisphaerales bacterium]